MIKSVFPDAETKALTVLFFDELDPFTPNRHAAGHRNGAKFVRTAQQVSPPLGYY